MSVDGPGGYNYSNLGPESDASGAGAGVAQYYIDSGSIPQLAWQYFTPSCSGNATATVFLTNREDHGNADGTVMGGEVPTLSSPSSFFSTEGGLSVFPVASEMAVFAPGFTVAAPTAAQQIQDLNTRHQAEELRFLLGVSATQTAPWQPISHQVPVQAGQTYAFVAELGHSVNMDNAPVELDCDATTTIEIELNEIAITKTCTPNAADQMNGQVGQLWNCSVDVTVPNAPFDGRLNILDAYTDTVTTQGQITSATAVSKNFNCMSGGECLVDGADFDASASETLEYQVFITSTSDQPTYPLQNCASGSFTAPDGTVTPVAGNCVTGQWVPRVEITKTCDPIEPVAVGPNTLNCQLNVTASDMATGTSVLVADGFVALPPAMATIPGTMMNVTSTEAWSCADGQLNTPGSVGMCALSAADMLDANGTSTINVSFEFDVDQSPAQVANCPFVDTANAKDIDGLFGEKSARNRIQDLTSRNKSSDLPDNCVVIDVPSPVVVTKLENVTVTKSCRALVSGQHNGVSGYFWNCNIDISVFPAPFTGTFTLTEDASQISSGSAVFLAASVSCTGLQADQLGCVMVGATMGSSTSVSVQLFADASGFEDTVKWENCAKGEAVSGSATMGSKSCVTTIIDPIKEPPLEEVRLEKSCGRFIPAEQDGVVGIRWNCEVKVIASPAPFAGTFTFTDDASAVSGSPNAQIISIRQQSKNWTCTPNAPTQVTECAIAGSNFSTTGTEIVGFDLFAETGKEPIKWSNCVSGFHTSLKGEKEDFKGNCETSIWTPTVVTPTTFDIDKTCKATGERQQFSKQIWFQPYACTITVTTNGVPFTDLLWITEGLSYGGINGNASMQQITSADAWSCASPLRRARSGERQRPGLRHTGGTIPARCRNVVPDCRFHSAGRHGRCNWRRKLRGYCDR